MAVREYQDHYGYVDRVGQQLGYNATYRYFKHPWHPMFFWLWDLALHQAYLLYKAHMERFGRIILDWRSFLIEIAESLIGDETSRVRAMKKAEVDAGPTHSSSRVPHSPSFGHKQNRCAVRQCKNYSTMTCLECNLYLCRDHVVQQAAHPQIQAVRSLSGRQ